MLWLNDSDFCDNRECERQSIYPLEDRVYARVWLERFRVDAGSMLALRALLLKLSWWDVWRASDDQVIDRVADLFDSRALHIHRQTAPIDYAKALPAKVEVPVVVPFPISDVLNRPSAGPVRNKVTDPPTFPPDVNMAAQAAVLAAAAQAGVPACYL